MSAKQDKTDYGKLRHVLIGAIRQMLYDQVGEKRVAEAYARHFRRKVPSDIRKTLVKLSKDQLIRLSRNLPDITNDEINELYEEFCYGARPKFQLYLVIGDSKAEDLKKNLPVELRKINNEINESSDPEHPPTFKEFELDEFIDDKKEGLTEIKYKYQARYSYVEPITEENSDIFELKHSFAWINKKNRYCAIHSGTEKTAPRVAEALKGSGIRLVGIKFTKEILDTVFELDKIQRASYYKGNAGQDEFQRVRLADPNLGAKIKFAKQYEEQYTKTGALYKERISSSLETCVGLMRDTGEIYLARTLRTSELRAWARRRFAELIDAYWTLQEKDTVKFFGNLHKKSLEMFKGMPEQIRQLAVQVVQVLADKKQPKTGTVNAPTDLGNTGSFFYVTYSYSCESCHNRVPVECAKCGSNQFNEDSDGEAIVCRICDNRLRKDNDAFVCQEGHEQVFSQEIKELRVLVPKARFSQLTSDLLEFIPEVRFNKDLDGFYLLGQEVVVTRNTRDVVVSVSDFVELRRFQSQKYSRDRAEQLDKILEKLPEKAKGIKSAQDFEEYGKDGTIRCLMKALQFALGVEVKPHHGHEFGDFSIQCKLNGQSQTIQGICKKYRKESITAGESLGGNIIRQSLQGMMNDAVDVLAVVSPATLDDGLKAMIQSAAKQFGKRLMFWDKKMLRAMLNGAMRRAKLQPSQVLKAIK